MDRKDFFDTTAYKKRYEQYSEIIKKETPDQKKKKKARVDKYLKDNILLDDIRKLLKLINHCPISRVTLFQHCTQIYLHAIQDLECEKTKEHYQKLYSFLQDPKIKKLNYWKEKYMNHYINKSFYKRKLIEQEQEINEEIIQFIMFVMKGSIAYIDVKPSGTDTDYYGKTEEDNEEETTETKVPDLTPKIEKQEEKK